MLCSISITKESFLLEETDISIMEMLKDLFTEESEVEGKEKHKTLNYMAGSFAIFGLFYTVLQLSGPVAGSVLSSQAVAEATDTIVSASFFIAVAGLNFAALWEHQNEE